MIVQPTKDNRYLSASGVVTPLFRRDINEVLMYCSDTSKFWAPKRNKLLSDYHVKEVHIVGSLLRDNNESDADILVIPSKFDQEDYRFFKQVLGQLFYANRPKTEAIDVFVRPNDEFPEKGSFEVTSQVRDLIGRWNASLV